MEKLLVYLDWNVFDRLEKIERLPEDERNTYSNLFALLKSDIVLVPYSNAHLHDLLRGYRKNPDYIEGHLAIIEEITKDVCICQYWEKKNAIWHYRSVRDFFESLKEEKDYVFEELFHSNDPLNTILTSTLELQKVPDEFKSMYREDPIFEIMFPMTKVKMNLLALCADIHNFSNLMHKDFSLYRTLRSYIVTAMHKLTKYQKLINSTKPAGTGTHKYLELDSLIDEFTPQPKNDKRNEFYHKIMDTFFKHDIKGYKSDGQFSNMIDDGLHTFYAAHCDVFLTNDDRCEYKAKKTYERLKINTQVFTPKEFVEKFYPVK